VQNKTKGVKFLTRYFVKSKGAIIYYKTTL
jgi:hypothetical protein